MDEPTLFRAYDVRGIYPSQINYQVAYRIAYALFSSLPGERFVIGYDMRNGTEDLIKAFAQGAKALNKQLVSIGMSTTDRVYFALGKYNFAGGIILTASHNPREWLGIKMFGPQVTPLNLEQIHQKYRELSSLDVPPMPSDTTGLELLDVKADYVKHVLSFVNVENISNVSVVVDAGNGLGGVNAQDVFRAIPRVELHSLFCEPNANFPHHEANPAIANSTKQLSDLVIKTRSKLGIAFDGDGDRCFLVDENGDYIPGHHLAALLARIMLERYPGSAVVYDYRNVLAIEHELKRNGGRPVRTATGNPFFKAAMRENQAVFGVEPTGHVYLRDNYYADSGIIAALIVLEYVLQSGKNLSELVAEYRQNFFACDELNLELEPGKSFADITERLKQKYHNGRISEPDGIVIEFAGWRMSARPSNTEPKIRVNIETNSQVQLNKLVIDIHELISEFVMEPGERKEDIAHLTPEQKFDQIIHNLWFTWNPHYILPFIDLYGDGWRRNPPPQKFSSVYGQQKFSEILHAKNWELDQTIRLLKDYLNPPWTWFEHSQLDDKVKAYLADHPIAYFCMEYGLVDWLQIYSGGLGILAGDFLKQASDCGVPMVGVGIFYHQGFFHQDFDINGFQVETYLEQNASDYPFELVKSPTGEVLEIPIEIVDHEVWTRVWTFRIGRINLYLLDTNFERNQRWEDKMITAHLYGGDNDTRIRQEILLGIGGARVLNALGISPSIYHMNEGHSGFLVLELARRLIEGNQVQFEDAIKEVSKQLVFTNHTLKQAGNDIFDYEMMRKYFFTYLDNLHTDFDRLFAIGKDEQYAKGGFSMTKLGMRHAQVTNAVSKLHGVAAKRLWPEQELLPITNGVHMPTWVSPEIHHLLDKYVGENWHDPAYQVDYNKIMDIPDNELWQVHLERKHKLISSLNNEMDLEFDPGRLTISWARRFAAYKRPDLISNDLARLAEIVNNTDRPVQIILTGKAHPQDQLGKGLLQQMWQSLNNDRFRHKVVLIPGYNWQLARRMVSGADIWLNTPYRYEEASGTSGMKAAANGVLQFTTLDGWTDEVDWTDKGWVISEEDPAHSLYDTLEKQIAPAFYDQKDWVIRMKRTMLAVIYNYSTQRMLSEYMQKIYLPLIKP